MGAHKQPLKIPFESITALPCWVHYGILTAASATAMAACTTSPRHRANSWLTLYNIYLGGVVETLPDDAVDEDPGHEEAGQQVGLHPAHVVDTLANAESLVPETASCVVVIYTYVFCFYSSIDSD